ncbi:7-carboxy-7-deazaguanine synthase QueE [Actinoplanes sp. CA-054009]
MRANDGTLLVNEIFGPTVQGEGVSLGRPAVFLRLAHCNLKCTFCDTPYTWDWRRYSSHTEAHPTPIAQIASDIRQRIAPGVRLLVITGGEPMLQQPAIELLLDLLHDPNRALEVEIETNGTIAPRQELTRQVSRFNVSVKPSSAGMTGHRRVRPEAVGVLRETNKAVWKFVVSDPSDVLEVEQFVDRFGVEPVFLMPEGTTPGQLNAKYEMVTRACIKNGWTVTPRLHIHIWGDKRAV